MSTTTTAPSPALDDRSGDDHDVDVLVVGGGAAGMAATLVLARSRRSVLVVDAGAPRNAPSSAVHSFLTRDGTPPTELAALARAEVEGYGATVRSGRAVAAVRDHEGFAVALADGARVRARRIVLATGLVDELPDVPGLADHWGRDVVHCPYCHGFEVRDRRIGVLATSERALHQVGLFRQLSDRVVLLRHTAPTLDGTQATALAARGVQVVDGEVVAVLGEAGALTGVELADGRTVPLGALVVAPRFRGRADLLGDLGLALVDHPSGVGTHLPVEMAGRTAAAGVWAAGNLADPMAQVVAAAAQGNLTGAVVNAELVEEDTRRAVASHVGAAASDDEREWDELYTGEDGTTPIWSGEPNGTLVAEVTSMTPGRALDVGCGEGGDAVWLAQQGWRVTALDPSGVALGRARAAAARCGADVAWVHAGLTAAADDLGTFDLVSAQYPGLRHTPDDAALRALLGAVAPGGTLLVVHHDVTGDHRQHGDGAHAPGDPATYGDGHAVGDAREDGDGHEDGPRFDPALYVLPHDVAAALDATWTVEVDETRPRPAVRGEDHGHVRDVVLRARRG